MLARNKDDIIAFAEGTAKVVGAVQTLYMIYDKITGTQYSENEYKILTTLKQTYEDCLDRQSPVQWELDEKHCPTHRIKANNWSRYCRELKKKIGGNVLYYHQMKVIAKVAAAYLEQRGIRHLGGGTSGDVLEQFISEWISFALTELPLLDEKKESIEKIDQRIEYLRRVDTHDAIFKYGNIDRATTKFDVFDDIEEQLIICKKRAMVEQSRISAREQFDESRTHISSLLTDCADVIFYARGTAVHDTALDLTRYVNDHHLRKRATDITYEKIRETHTGRMLFDVISHAGLKAFNADITELNIKPSDYFDDEYQLKAFNLHQFKCDLLPWIVGEEAERNQLQLIQQLCQTMLRIARLKDLIETAYDLTGDCGNLWAYDDKEGKISLSGLLFLMDKECDLLKSHFDAFYEHNREARKEYSRRHKIDANKGANPNFNEVDTLSGQIVTRIKQLKNKIAEMRQQLNQYPGDALEQINKKKQQFYHSLNQFIQRFYPEHFATYGIQALDETPVEERAIRKQFQFNMDIVDNINKDKLPLLSIPFQSSTVNPTYFYLNKTEFLSYSPLEFMKPVLLKRLADWSLGQSYADWTRGYFLRHQSDYYCYQQRCRELAALSNAPENLDAIGQLAQNFQQQMQQLKATLERERPRWRFKWSLWPIKTKGWPFNHKARRFAEFLTQELNRWNQEITQITSEAIQHLTNIHDAEEKENQFLPPQHEGQTDSPEPLIDQALSSQAQIIGILQESAETADLIDNTLDSISIASATETDIDPAIDIQETHDTTEIPDDFALFKSWHSHLWELLKTSRQQPSTPFHCFVTSDELKSCLHLFLSLKEQIDPCLAENMSSDCYNLITLLHAMRKNFSPDEESQSQIEIVLQFLTLLVSDLDANDHQQNIDKFLNETQEKFVPHHNP